MKKYIITLIPVAIIIFLSQNAVAGDHLGDIDIHGFISQGYLQTDKNNYLAETEDGTFQFNEMGINFTTDVTDRLRLGIQFFARDLGPNGNDEIIVDWANADFRWRDWLGVRVGRNKGFIGFYTATRDIDMFRTSVLLPQSVYGEMLRDSLTSNRSIDFYGRILLGAAGILAYEAGVGVPEFSEDSGIAYAFEQSFSILNLKIDSVDPSMSGAIRFIWYAPFGFRAKAGWVEGNDLFLSGNLDIFSKFEYEYDYDGYFVSAEYQQEKLTLTGEIFSSEVSGKWDLGLGYEDRRPVRYQGWYVALNYDFNDFFKTAVSYAEFHPDVDNKDGKRKIPESMYYNLLGINGIQIYGNDFEAWLKTTTFSFRFDLNEYWLLKLEVAYNDGFGAYTSAYNPEKTVNGRDILDIDRYWFLYAAKITYSF